MAVKEEIRLTRHGGGRDCDAGAIRGALRQLLGDAAVDIQHIGSTAIRGILAVPIIDIALGLSREADVPKLLERLSRHGYRRIPGDATGMIRLARLNSEKTAEQCRLWVTHAGSTAWHDLIAFRDYLNNHVFAANAYEELKLQLLAAHPNDSAAYAAGKTPFVQNILRLSRIDPLLGKRLTIVIDRPLGSTHPEYPDTVYPLNYGYVPGIPAPDGESLDAYIYGVKKPLHRFTGTVVAVIHRRNDTEDKLVVAPSGTVVYEPQITEAVRFTEQYFDTSVICIYEKSCGAILYRIRADGEIEYLILYQHRSGTWSVPKGHIAAGETERETALREVREETGLHVALIDGFRRELSYTVSAKASKNLVIFLAEAQGELSLGESEISDSLWAEKATAIRRLGGRSIGRVLESADQFIRARRRSPAKR